MFSTIAFLLFVLPPFAPSVQPPAASDDGAPFVVGVLRRDGVVSPFAAFNGKDWELTWPDEVRGLELPIGLESVPRKWWGKSGPVEEMTAWIDGVNRKTLKLSKLALVRVMCRPRLGVATDYQSPESVPPLSVQPYPKDALVVSGHPVVEPVEIVPPASPDAKAAAIAIADQFTKAENVAIDGFTAWKHPVRKDDRRKVPIEVEAMYRAPMDTPGWRATYIEAVRKYPPGPEDDDCGLITSVNGWILAGPDGKQTIKLSGRVTYCDRRGVAYMLPLGLIKARERTYWAAQFSGFDREGYAILRPTPKDVTQETYYSAGICPF